MQIPVGEGAHVQAATATMCTVAVAARGTPSPFAHFSAVRPFYFVEKKATRGCAGEARRSGSQNFAHAHFDATRHTETHTETRIFEEISHEHRDAR